MHVDALASTAHVYRRIDRLQLSHAEVEKKRLVFAALPTNKRRVLGTTYVLYVPHRTSVRIGRPIVFHGTS